MGGDHGMPRVPRLPQALGNSWDMAVFFLFKYPGKPHVRLLYGFCDRVC